MIEATDDGRDRRGDIAPSEALVLSLFARLDIVAFTIAVAVVAAAAMFVATVALILAGAAPGQEVGPNLSSMATFWPGYSVTWAGAPVGAVYAALFGGAAGFALALFWNFAHLVIIGLATLRFAVFGE